MSIKPFNKLQFLIFHSRTNVKKKISNYAQSSLEVDQKLKLSDNIEFQPFCFFAKALVCIRLITFHMENVSSSVIFNRI